LFIENFVPNLKVETVRITPENEQHLRSGYLNRTNKELPVLTRWFPRHLIHVPDATYLDLILYSKQQILEEKRAMNEELSEEQQKEDWDWGLISIKAQLHNFEQPMSPITMMRNALGKEHGGSGVPINRTLYDDSVKFWSSHALID